MKTNGYWVYKITTPDNMVYVGYSGKKYTSERWGEYCYKSTSLQPFVDKYGWDNLKKEVIKTDLTKNEAICLEEELRVLYKQKGVVINKNKSGGVWSMNGEKKYNNIYYKEHKEEHNNYCKNYRKEHNDYLKEYRKEHIEERRNYLRKWRENKKQQKQLEELGYIPLF